MAETFSNVKKIDIHIKGVSFIMPNVGIFGMLRQKLKNQKTGNAVCDYTQELIYIQVIITLQLLFNKEKALIKRLDNNLSNSVKGECNSPLRKAIVNNRLFHLQAYLPYGRILLRNQPIWLPSSRLAAR